ncbi:MULTISPECIES: stalk domain-containing protein [Paenibacillus]|uniref:DNA-directed RNA polymerase subunit beta n=1 Tax=Paenibacillus campinasensis TaxID=66347 RepID=A0A268ETW9_9BACL|nr:MULTISPECIES: stalk domain-containing protein [Paenibacillus]PAD76551.1 DNA-directed RNA polymerase subunit beta [Paenibacillus campinasensis]PAK55593.1 DNA-directed RNA polymerase subunit beta [Paenibacillus sp. 7541]
MKLKTAALLTVLIISQVAGTLPVSAESSNTPASQEAVSGAEVTTQANPSSGVQTTEEQPQGGQTDATTDQAVASEVVEGEGEENQPGTENQGGADSASAGNPDGEGNQTTEKPATSETAGNPNELILYFNSTKMVHGGTTYHAPQPMQVKKGVSYVPIRALVDRVGFKVSYDQKTKETLIQKDGTELRFKTDSDQYLVNGVAKTMKGTSYQTNNTFMVPLTAIMQALEIPYKVDNQGKRVIMNLQAKPVAKFTVEPKEIFVGEPVVYITESKAAEGTIINERWEGRQDVFNAPGQYVVTYSVQDSSGAWSAPYSVTLNVIQPNQPPVARFETDKPEYKMGELITITDFSYDDRDPKELLTYKWENRAYAYFTPGPQTIKLTVTDRGGLSTTYEHTVNITSETLYSEENFNMLFIPEGEKYTFIGNVMSRDKLNYSFYDEPSTLIRSNSPETVNSEGIVYRETASGDMRFMIHHVNNVNKDVKMYVVATNINNAPVTLRTDYLGFAGPSPIATAAGKRSVQNYFQSMLDGSKQSSVTLEPGEQKLVMTELSAIRMRQGHVISLYSDMYSDLPVQFDVIMIDDQADPLEVLDQLPILDRDGVHNRGTYEDSTRVIRYADLIGRQPERLALGDNADDPNLVGVDPMVGDITHNTGNFGVLYKITLDRVAPNVLISFNPRGGKYSGYAMVNGKIVPIYSLGQVSPTEQAVLHRTGNFEQKVEILLTAAPGSNLPINLLFTPMPSRVE